MVVHIAHIGPVEVAHIGPAWQALGCTHLPVAHHTGLAGTRLVPAEVMEVHIQVLHRVVEGVLRHRIHIETMRRTHLEPGHIAAEVGGRHSLLVARCSSRLSNHRTDRLNQGGV